MGHFAKLTLHNGEAGVVEAASTHRLGEIGRIEAHVQCFLFNLVALCRANFSGTFDCYLKGNQLLSDECLDRLRQHLLFARQLNIHF